MDHPLRVERIELAVRPWRTATLVAAAVAALELALLVVLGGALLAKPETAHRASAKSPSAASATRARQRSQQTVAKRLPAELPRRKVEVVVLNGNGRQGAAAAAAARVHRKGYRIGLVANAPNHQYAASLVMYRPGFVGEAQRLARDIGVKLVGPLDGMRQSQLHGAHAVVILGA